jgi:hypothetical protein
VPVITVLYVIQCTRPVVKENGASARKYLPVSMGAMGNHSSLKVKKKDQYLCRVRVAFVGWCARPGRTDTLFYQHLEQEHVALIPAHAPSL